jgi:hypothetical protein
MNMQYALINNNLVENVAEADQAWADSVATDWQAVINITNANPQPGIGWEYVNGHFVAPVVPPTPITFSWVITRNEFQKRFPLTANGVSTKYDLMTLFLTDTAYAESLGVTGSAIFDLRSLIITGNNRLGVVSEVDLKDSETINYVNMTTNALFPDVFRLTQDEANMILNTPAPSANTNVAGSAPNVIF